MGAFVVRLLLSLLAIILWAFFFSCKQKNDHSKEIGRLDSALINLKEAERDFFSADTTSMRTSFNFAAGKLHVIANKIAKDTLKKNTVSFLSNAFEHTGNLQNLLDNKKFWERALKESAQKIDDLKHDLKEDLIENNKSQEYIANEINTSKKICETVGRTINKAKSSVVQLDSMKTALIHLSDSLQSK